MIELVKSSPVFIAGLIAITVLDALGAIASRILRFKYGLMFLPSLMLYVFVGAYVSRDVNFSAAILVNIALGFYDATVGWIISRKLKANTGLTEEQLEKVTISRNLKVMLAFAIIATIIGYVFAQIQSS